MDPSAQEPQNIPNSGQNPSSVSVNNNNPATIGPISASDMGLSQPAGRFEIKSLIKPATISFIGIMIIVVALLIFKSMSGYGNENFSLNDVNFSVYFSKSAKQVHIGEDLIQGKDKTTGSVVLLDVAKAVKSKADCQAIGTVEIIDTPTIEGERHNLCYSKSLKVYAMNFRHNSDWYFFTLFSKVQGQAVNQETVKSIAKSIRIN